MNGLTKAPDLVNSAELPLSKFHFCNKMSPLSPVRLLFRRNSGEVSRTFTLKRTPRQFSSRPNLQRHSTATLRSRHLTAMDSDSPELVATTTASSSLDDQSVKGELRKELPEELSRSVVKLSCETSTGGNCDVYLVGTAHVSLESCKEVQAVINFLKPQVVFLELCANRRGLLTQNLKIGKVPTMGEMVGMWKKNHNMFGILYSRFLAKVASKLEVYPGSEFRVAHEEAMKYGGKVILGDRPVHITLRRTWLKMPQWHKTKLIYSLMFQAAFLPSPARLNTMVKKLDDVDKLTRLIQEMSKEYPTLMETLVHERDQYMSSKLLKIAREHSSVVAVVGKGHLPGIQKYWKQPVSVKDLLELPSTKPAISVRKVLSTAGVAVAGAVIVSGIYLSSRK